MAANGILCDLCGRSFFQDSLRFHRPSCAKKQENLEVPCPGCALYVQKSFLSQHMKKCDAVGAERRRASPAKLKMKGANSANRKAIINPLLQTYNSEEVKRDNEKHEKMFFSLLKVCERMKKDVISYREEATINQEAIDKLLAKGIDKTNLTQPIQVLNETLLVIKNISSKYQHSLSQLYTIIEKSPYCLQILKSLANDETVEKQQNDKYIQGIIHAHLMLRNDYEKFIPFPSQNPKKQEMTEMILTDQIHGERGEDGRVSCNICSRKFGSDRIHEHYRICGKLKMKKQRRPFSSQNKRLNGILPPELRKKVMDELNGKNASNKKYNIDWHSNWRRKHEELLQVANMMKGIKTTTSSRDVNSNHHNNKSDDKVSMTTPQGIRKSELSSKFGTSPYKQHPPTSDIKIKYSKQSVQNEEQQAIYPSYDQIPSSVSPTQLFQTTSMPTNGEKQDMDSSELPNRTCLVENDSLSFQTQNKTKNDVYPQSENGGDFGFNIIPGSSVINNSNPSNLSENVKDKSISGSSINKPNVVKQTLKKASSNFVEYTKCGQCGKKLPLLNLQLHELRCQGTVPKRDKPRISNMNSLPHPPSMSMKVQQQRAQQHQEQERRQKQERQQQERLRQQQQHQQQQQQQHPPTPPPRSAKQAWSPSVPWGSAVGTPSKEAQRRRKSTIETSTRSRGSMLTDSGVKSGRANRSNTATSSHRETEKETDTTTGVDPYAHLPSYMRPTASTSTRSKRNK